MRSNLVQSLLVICCVLGAPQASQSVCGDDCVDSCTECCGHEFLSLHLFDYLKDEESGVDFDADLTQFFYGVVNGGVEQQGRYTAHGDYVANLDMQKLSGLEGLFIKVKAEHRFGQQTDGLTGAIIPSQVLGDLPVRDSEDLMLTNLLFMQFFSENFGVFFGKMDTFDGDQNAFASGRGKTQFSNGAFVVAPTGLRTVVYSTLGAGFVVLVDKEPIFTFTILNATDTSGTSGFHELFDQGAAIVPELRLPTNIAGLPGHVLLGGTWSSRQFAALDQSPLIAIPRVPIAQETGSWSLYTNFDQHLYVNPDDETQGWGIWGRAGIADNASNPIAWFLSAGIGGNSMINGREEDTFGVGWYYSSTSRDIAPFLGALLGGLGDGQGVECYYSVPVTEWLTVTGDIQVIDPARRDIDTALFMGMRAVTAF